MGTDLVHGRHFEPSVDELLEMSNGEAAHADAAEETLLLRIDGCFPALQTHLRAANRPVKEVQVDISQAALGE